MATRFSTTSCYNPFFMDGMEVDKLCFYKDGKIIASMNWFGSNNEYRYMVLPIEVKKATKLNLERTDCFYMRSKGKDWTRAYNVYIHADLVGLKSLGREDYINDWKQTSTREAFELTVTGEKRIWHRDENGEAKQTYKQGEFTEKIYANYEFKKSDEWKKCEAIAKHWKELAYINVSASDVHRIMEAYTITKKRAKATL